MRLLTIFATFSQVFLNHLPQIPYTIEPILNFAHLYQELLVIGIVYPQLDLLHVLFIRLDTHAHLTSLSALVSLVLLIGLILQYS